jgi:hypothetical protein
MSAVVVVAGLGLGVGWCAAMVAGPAWWRKALMYLLSAVAVFLLVVAAAGFITVALSPTDTPTYPCDDCPSVGNPGG